MKMYYLTKTNVSFIKDNMNRFLNELGTFIANTICFTNREITNKYTFITLDIKFTKIFLTIVVDKALTFKSLEI